MVRLNAFTDSEQLSLDDVLAELRAEAPPEATITTQKGIPRAPARTDPDVIMADLDTVRDVSGVKIGTISHNGTCPYTRQCETRRRRLPIYRPGHPCHWQAWGDWQRCPIYQNGGTT